ncbi:hypothetical protein ACTL6P_14965 [Endozoicomonas acroporae]|uniref:hypothetical protein n=1 Tax=Endozoicomonas acroporae TaxID=1701104 RepID=UPI0011AF88A9|nr:hypothetical protein [Endozoicomonas acroporae]
MKSYKLRHRQSAKETDRQSPKGMQAGSELLRAKSDDVIMPAGVKAPPSPVHLTQAYQLGKPYSPLHI